MHIPAFYLTPASLAQLRFRAKLMQIELAARRQMREQQQQRASKAA